MAMEQTWRWFGPNDPVSLRDIMQAGAEGIVTALHHIPNGAVWSVEAIRKRIDEIEQGSLPANGAGQPRLRWSVVESVPVHEDIKKGLPQRDEYIDHYIMTLRNLAECGISTICYNFMPVLDWTRTDLNYMQPDGSEALRFDAVEFAAFDLHILQRSGATGEYAPQKVEQAAVCFAAMSDTEKLRLQQTIIAGLPGAEEGYSLAQLQATLAEYRGMGASELRDNLVYFLKAVVPAAEDAGVRLAIHPDDPPWPVLGLPRVVSTESDLVHLLSQPVSPANGFTMCTGSLGVRVNNDLIGIIERLGERIHFAHLRSTTRDETDPHSFYEANHLEGDVDMFGVVKALVQEERKRTALARADWRIPFRPDHGHRMLDDLQKKTNPGYSAIGRLRGLAELRGLELGIERAFQT